MTKAKRRKKERQRVDATRWTEEQSGGFSRPSLNLPDNIELIKISGAGVKRLDILPYKCGKGNPCADEGVEHFERTYYVHRNVGAGEDTYTCPRETAGKRCPVCEFRSKLSRDPDADDQLIKDLRPKKRQMFNVIDLGERDKGIQLLEISYHNFGKMLLNRIEGSDPEDEYRYFADLEAGQTLRVNWVESSWGGGTYYEAGNIDFKARKEGYDESVLDDVYCLDALVNILPYDKLKAILLETDGDEEQEEKPKKEKEEEEAPFDVVDKDDPATDDEDDDEWEFDDEGDDEEPIKDDPDSELEEEPPKKKTVKKRRTTSNADAGGTGKAKKGAGGKKKAPKKAEPPKEEEDDDDWDEDDDDWDD